MTRVLSGIQPTGDTHVGNYVGAIRHWATDQHEQDSFCFIADLHALTVPLEPEYVRSKTLEVARILLAAGLDPEVATIFVQSHIPEHAEMAWLLSCVATYGELARMTQFKEKSKGKKSVSVGLYTYPVLQAADIVLYDADRVPVGDDQRQHLELARDIAIRFNSRYGDTLVVPEAAIPRFGSKIMDLQSPENRMSKSRSSKAGQLLLLEAPESMTKKLRRAVTDTETEVRFDRATKAGVSNLIELLAVATDRDPKEVASGYSAYGPLKEDTAAAVVEFLRPFHDRYRQLEADPAYVEKVLAAGAEKARDVASQTLARAKSAMGLIPPTPG